RSARCSLSSATHTRAPSRANTSAIPRPMPWPAPVTSATLPASRSMGEGDPYRFASGADRRSAATSPVPSRRNTRAGRQPAASPRSALRRPRSHTHGRWEPPPRSPSVIDQPALPASASGGGHGPRAGALVETRTGRANGGNRSVREDRAPPVGGTVEAEHRNIARGEAEEDAELTGHGGGRQRRPRALRWG